MNANITNVLVLLVYTMTAVQAAAIIATAQATHFLELYLVLAALVILAIYDFHSHGRPKGKKPSLSALLDLALLWIVAVAATTDMMSKDHYGSSFDILLCLTFICFSTYHVLFKGDSAEFPTILLALCVSNPIFQPRVFTPYNLDLLLAVYVFTRYGKLTRIRIGSMLFPVYLLAGAIFIYNRPLGFEFFCRWAGPLMLLIATAEICRSDRGLKTAESAVIWSWFYVLSRFAFEYAYRFSLFGLQETAALRITVAMVQVIGVLPYLLPGLFLAVRRLAGLSNADAKTTENSEPGNLWSGSRIESAVLWLGISLSVFLLLIGGGRAALMGLVTGSLVLGGIHLITSGKLDPRKVGAALGICAVAACGTAFFYGKHLISSGEGSMAARLFMYKTFPAMIAEAPLFGHGPYSRPNRIYRVVVNSPDPAETISKIQQGMMVHPHNTFLHLAEETGLTGLTLGAVMFFSLFSPVKTLRVLSKTPWDTRGPPHAAIMVSIAALIPVALLDSLIATKGYLTLLAVLSGILIGRDNSEISGTEPSSKWLDKLLKSLLFISILSASIGWAMVSCPADFFKRNSDHDERKGNLTGMRINLSMALEFDPYNYSVLNKLGDLCIDLKDYNAAFINFTQSLQLCKTQYYPYLRLGDLAFLGKKFDDAAKNYTSAMNFGVQKTGLALLCRSIARREGGRREEHMTDLVTLCSYLPEALQDPEVVDRDAASKLPDLLMSSLPPGGPTDPSLSSELSKNICLSMYNLGMTDKLKESLETLMKRFPGEAIFVNLFANILQFEHGPDAVNRLYLSLNNLSVKHLNHYGKMLYALRKMNDAREIFLGAIENNRGRLFDDFNLEGYEYLAKIAKHFKDTDETLRNLRRILFFRPADHRLYIKIADTLFTMGQEFREEARENYTLALGEVYDLNVFRPSKRNIPLFFSRKEENMKRMLDEIEKIKKELEHCNDRINFINRELGIES